MKVQFKGEKGVRLFNIDWQPKMEAVICDTYNEKVKELKDLFKVIEKPAKSSAPAED